MPPLWILFYLILEFSHPAVTKTSSPTELPRQSSIKYDKKYFNYWDIEKTENNGHFLYDEKSNYHEKHVPEIVIKGTKRHKNLWNRLEDYSLQRYLRLNDETKKDNRQLLLEEDMAYRKRKRKDSYRIPKQKTFSGVSYHSLEKDKNPFYKLLKSVNLIRNVNETYQNMGEMRVWKKHVVNNAYLEEEDKRNHKTNEKSKVSDILDSKRRHIYEDELINRMDERREMMREFRNDNKDVVVYKSSTEPTLGVSFTNPQVDMIKRFRREVADPEDITGPCKPFVDGSPDKQTFYSPGFPGHYPNQTDCVVVLTAPPGRLIKLDFRDNFDIEPSEECKFDFLEVRDGAHGYSPLIGQFCGKEFPDILQSKGRYLWLHFHSDDNIEYSGFTAVYEFIPRPTTQYYQPEEEACRIEKGGNEGFINKSDIDPERIKYTIDYGVPLDCMWIITVDKDKKIMLQFKKFLLDKPNDCDMNLVDIFSNRTDLPSRLKNYCGSMADAVESSSNILHIRFMAEAKAINSTFEALFTAFREKGKEKGCNDDELDCEDNTCIAADLKCNGRTNCRFKWDEDECDKVNGSQWMQSHHIIIIMVVFSLILTGMSAAFIFNCVRKLISDHRIIQEHIRQSRENYIDEIGRMPTKIAEPVSKISLKHDSLTPGSRSDEHLENVDCYVPGVGEILPILLQGNKRERSSGDTLTIPPQTASINNRDNEIIVRQQSLQRQDKDSGSNDKDNECDSDDQANVDVLGSTNLPEMCDSSCQTRESLFHTPAFSHPSSERSFSPGAPSVDYSKKPVRPRDFHSSDFSDRPTYQQTSTPFSTFGYSGNAAQRDSRSHSSKTKDPRYKAEAVIEMEHFEDEGNGNSISDTNRNLDSNKGLHSKFDSDDHKNRNILDFEQHSKPISDRTYLPDDNLHTEKLHKKHSERRPYSVETTKSAPDVIIMTKSH